jgi:prolyl-tRNA editing enzyme YbaK/EbsC (Cys-tRNA(Pro) deacylase)
MRTDLSPGALRVQHALRAMGHELDVMEHGEPTRTAEEAARRAGCAIGQIVKSLVFRGATSGKPILVLTSGANRVAEDGMAAHVGERLRRAEAAFVLSVTGFDIGGVPPVALQNTMECFMDEDLMAFDAVWASGGSENAIFMVAPQALQSMTMARLVRVKA